MLSNTFSLVIKSLFLVAIIGLLILIWGQFSWSIPWEATTYADAEEFGFRSFQKGLFQFGITGEFYTLAETFSAKAIERTHWMEAILFMVIWTGFCLVITVITYLRRVWFFIASGLLIFFLISLNLAQIGLFGLSGELVNVMVIAGFIGPVYLFQTYPLTDRFFIRFVVFLGISGVLALSTTGGFTVLMDQLLTGGYLGFVLMVLFFLLMISEELIFFILQLVTRARGGQNNHIHFIAFSLIYLVFIGLYYARKIGLIHWEFSFFNPMLLLAISSVISLWSLKHKKDLYDSTLVESHFSMLASGLGLVVFGFLGIAYLTGNDPVYEATNFFIIYMHLGFGVFFFLYIISNLIDPLSQGLQVYKVVYKEQSFPYVTARIAGLVAITAFFLYSSKQSYFFYRAGHYNYLGQQAETLGENTLALRYYQEANVYGHDNHFSNYKMGYSALAEGRMKEANHRFGRASLRNPSPQSFVNHAGTYGILGEVATSQAVLETGLKLFPENSELSNNLGMILYDLGEKQQAELLIKEAGKDPSWSQASLVNKWKVRSDIPEDEEYLNDFEKGNLAVKTNVVSHAMRMGKSLDLKSDSTNLIGFPLHRQTFLINLAWYTQSEAALNLLRKEFSQPIEYSVQKIATNAFQEAAIYSGDINAVFSSLDQDMHQANEAERAEIENKKGRIALEQHALTLAAYYFKQAEEKGLASAKMNLVATLLEAHDFEFAMKEMERFSKEDSSFFQIMEDLKPLLSTKAALPINGTFLYYSYEDFSISVLENELSVLSPYLIENLWTKISKELLLQESFEKLNQYQRVFEKHLDSSQFEEVNLIQSLHKGGQVNAQGKYASFQGVSDSLLAPQLKAMATRNSLNEPLVLAVAKRLKSDYPQLAYDLLVEAIDINQTSVALYKAYCLQALSSGYTDYGKAALQKLKKLTTPTDYQAFEKAFNQHVAAESSFSSTW